MCPSVNSTFLRGKWDNCHSYHTELVERALGDRRVTYLALIHYIHGGRKPSLYPSAESSEQREGGVLGPVAGVWVCRGDPMMAVFSRMQRPRKVYQLNLPGPREASQTSW